MSLPDWLFSIDRAPLVHVVDAVIAFTVVEGCALVAWHRATGRGVAPRDFVANGIAGLCLMLALRACAAGIGFGVVALCLGAAGAAHAADIASRWRRGSASRHGLASPRRFPDFQEDPR